MNKLLIGLSLLAVSATANANFFDSNNGEWKMGPNGPYYEESDWPEWTPMYWMEEMSDSFSDDNDDSGFGNMPFMGGNNSFGNMPFMGNNNNNYPMMPYGAPMGYGQAPMMAPPMVGAPMMQPQMMPMAPMPMQPQMMPMPAPMAAPVGTPGPAAAPAPTAPATN
ncbi:MAG: hypothetical protein PHE17_13865 [Thiothrix sp.]|jgi:hypothetical protein|uniref:hypothetical protein n=1 Tax=Thiothrix sp. TaxID=1032 RepID=UPI00260FBE9F|nr:hypothetical protein [Thiothrix sp.]MDD5394094.1 hypothetical protein [Thiothrix sp.]